MRGNFDKSKTVAELRRRVELGGYLRVTD